jgi:hypothetical protein
MALTESGACSDDGISRESDQELLLFITFGEPIYFAKSKSTLYLRTPYSCWGGRGHSEAQKDGGQVGWVRFARKWKVEQMSRRGMQELTTPRCASGFDGRSARCGRIFIEGVGRNRPGPRGAERLARRGRARSPKISADLTTLVARTTNEPKANEIIRRLEENISIEVTVKTGEISGLDTGQSKPKCDN